jgi:hypothetical protein
MMLFIKTAPLEEAAREEEVNLSYKNDTKVKLLSAEAAAKLRFCGCCF